ncbi:hypothetical protein [Massilia sp. NR 4-1]|uniref:hypothetical protein n=1 Tax=Massilia sp. NR 4-1 TaxID=1678028 RepID=UPI00067D6114|nr:hypothetical protein [Massilia sp. NR 4-1]AKU24166.1 hypothetical protein ACZ75_24640 [Massilia sp. NR 4-1]
MHLRSLTVAAKPRRMHALLAALAATSLLGCSGSSTSTVEQPPVVEQPKSAQLLRGEVTLGAPVTGAKVRILSGTSEVGADTTIDNGSFALTTIPLTEQALKALRVEQQACVDAANILSCATLSASLEGAPLSGIAHVGVRSTLVDRLVRNKQMKRADAEKRVTAYLGLDEGILAQDMVDPNLFNPSRFVSETFKEAQAGGISLDKQLDALVDKLAADPALQRKYPPLLALNPIVKTVGVELAKGAIGAVGGELAGKAMSLLGLSDDSMSRDLQEIKGQLADVNRRLDTMSRQLDVIETGMKQTLRRLEQIDIKLDDLARRQLAQRVLTQTTALVSYVEEVKNITLDLRRAGTQPLPIQASERKRLKTAIENLISKRSLISATLAGTAGNPSLIASVVDSEFPKPAILDMAKDVFFGPKVINSIQNFVRYYDDINILSYYLLIEYYNALDQENGIRFASCPLTPATGVNYKMQCNLFYELQTAREAYLQNGPQESLPVDGMFLVVNQSYAVPPNVIYPSQDFNYQIFGEYTGRGGQSAVNSTMDMKVYPDLSKAQQDEVRGLVKTWYFMEPAAWFGLFIRYTPSGGNVRKIAVDRGAPESAFVTVTGDYAIWSLDTSRKNPWVRVSTNTGSADASERGFDNAKLVLWGQFQRKSDIEKYMGKVMAARFQIP